jgi:hypothetical protein
MNRQGPEQFSKLRLMQTHSSRLNWTVSVGLCMEGFGGIAIGNLGWRSGVGYHFRRHETF